MLVACACLLLLSWLSSQAIQQWINNGGVENLIMQVLTVQYIFIKHISDQPFSVALCFVRGTLVLSLIV